MMNKCYLHSPKIQLMRNSSMISILRTTTILWNPSFTLSWKK